MSEIPNEYHMNDDEIFDSLQGLMDMGLVQAHMDEDGELWYSLTEDGSKVAKAAEELFEEPPDEEIDIS